MVNRSALSAILADAELWHNILTLAQGTGKRPKRLPYGASAHNLQITVWETRNRLKAALSQCGYGSDLDVVATPSGVEGLAHDSLWLLRRFLFDEDYKGDLRADLDRPIKLLKLYLKSTPACANDLSNPAESPVVPVLPEGGLDKRDLDILEYLRKTSPVLQFVCDIQAGTDISSRTLGKRLIFLIQKKLVSRPKGERKGATITAEGKEILEQLLPPEEQLLPCEDAD
ncbi:MAG TPA: hypothetical protein VGY77_08050 [Gemmataceae bacterium]|jgi:hypothetical protein|nr:hypothetical protein [Gemmataceae bacterium]